MIEAYTTWQVFSGTVAGESLRWSGKPGLESWDAISPATRLLAETLCVQPGERVLDLRCGTGICGALAARCGARVTLCDDSIVAVQAATRTLAQNGLSGEVVHGEIVTGTFDLVLLDTPRGREWVRHLLRIAAGALCPGGQLLIAGPNRGGIKGFIDDASEIVGPCQVLRVKAAHRVAVARRVATDSAVCELSAGECIGEATLGGRLVRFAARPGVFSYGEVDGGTRALVEAMSIEAGERVLDLGCGSGIVGVVAAQQGAEVVLADSSAVALDTARATLELNRMPGRVVASDSASAVLNMRFDVVATNPPFHQGLGVEFDVAQQFVRDSAEVLAPGGRLYLVANRFLRYESAMSGRFSQIRPIFEDSRFRVLEAIR